MIENIITAKNLSKKYKGFQLNIDHLEIPKGFATALIGENGAGKTTLLDMMSGVNLNYKGTFSYFEQLPISDVSVKERIGYTAAKSYFLTGWNLEQIEEVSEVLFDEFYPEQFRSMVDELCIPKDKKVSELSDGNIIKLMLACMLARNTDMLILDEPASPLDPLMRDKLCDLFRRYLSEKDGERSILFSTHNVADMEAVTDYVIIMNQGRVIETGFVEDLKERYVLINGDEYYEAISNYLIGGTVTPLGYSGLCLSSDLEHFAGMNVNVETPTLSQISIHILKKHSQLK